MDPTVPAAATEGDAPPSREAGGIAVGLVIASVLFAALVDLGDGFTPRIETIDALAGLAIGALIVDRLLTFVPPLGAKPDPKQREIDLTVLRLGYGAVLAAAFVSLTDLRAVKALTASDSIDLSAGVDRAIAVLALAGGVAGLARLLSAINPQPATDGNKDPNNAEGEGGADDTIPPPSGTARIVGLIAVGVGAAVALFALGDKNGIDLLGPDKLADGTVALVVRFAPVLVAAAIIQELAEFGGRAAGVAKHNTPVVLGGIAVVLGVAAARIFDLYLLHNIGFFGTTQTTTLNQSLAASSDLELWGDAFLTGLAIAAGTKPLHDFASRLRKAKKPATVTT
jgi:hypothetical protein